MASITPTRRRLLPSFLLATLLIASMVAVTFAQDAPAVEPAPAGAALPSATPISSSPAPTGGVLAAESRSGPSAPPFVIPSAAPSARPTARPLPVPKTPAPKPRTKTVTAPKHVTTAAFHGRNHVWMPALRIDRSVAGYACSNSSYPGQRVYRWGCAGANNVYLFGHASGVFRPLHDAYVRGKLRKGMSLFYADGSGVVHRYTIAWWKVTTATKGTWAYAAQSTPSLTLQTCLGAQSQYRLIVRLSRAD